MKRLHLFLIPLFVLFLLSGCTLLQPKKQTGTGSTLGMSSAASSPKPVETMEQIQAKADKGDAEAQFNLGMIFLEGTEIPKDLEKGRMWLERAAQSGFAKAQFNLGVMYYQGIDGVKQNLPKARVWFYEASQKKDMLALFNLGVMAYRGEGGRQSFDAAKTSFTSAATLGYAEAAYNLGVMYAKGEGVKRDTLEAIGWFMIAEAQGSTKAGEIAATLKGGLSEEDLKKANERAVALARTIEEKIHGKEAPSPSSAAASSKPAAGQTLSAQTIELKR